MIIFIMISTFSVKMHSLSKQSESRDNSAEINNKPGCGGGRCHCNQITTFLRDSSPHLQTSVTSDFFFYALF